MEKDNRVIYIIILVCLLIFVPLSLYGSYLKYSSKIDLNPEKRFKIDSSLYFYNNDELIGTYSCKSDDCGYALNNENLNIMSAYAFIQDGTNLILYSYKDQIVISVFEDIIYGSDEYLIVKKNNKYGSISLKNLQNVIPYEYEKLVSIKPGNLIAINENTSYIIDEFNNVLFETNGYIENFNNNYISVLNNNVYEIYDYNNVRKLNNINIENVEFTDNYTAIKMLDYILVYSLLDNSFIYNTQSANIESFEIKESEKLDVYINGTLHITLDI